MNTHFKFCEDRLERITDWMQNHVTQGRLAGLSVQIARPNHIIYKHHCGLADREAGIKVDDQTLWRIYSMTKPITSLAVMMLYERGLFQLDQPISDFIPDFHTQGVWKDDGKAALKTEGLHRPVTVHDLLTHQSGVIYGDPLGNALELAYDKLNIRGGAHALSTQKVVQALAKLPLAFQPGERWEYGYSTDILGYLVEVLSGMPLSQFFQSQILDPLNMVNTGFKQRENASVRLASSYGSTQNGLELLANAQDPNYGANVTFESGGAGLLSTLQDYQKLANLFLGRGEVEGIRLLGRKTFDFFVQNQLDGDLASHGQSHFSETTFEGVGFGLGMMVMIDPVRAKLLASKGEFGWGGMASTAFWIDPVENYSVILMTQLIPSSTYTLRRDLRVLTQQALI